MDIYGEIFNGIFFTTDCGYVDINPTILDNRAMCCYI